MTTSRSLFIACAVAITGIAGQSVSLRFESPFNVSSVNGTLTPGQFYNLTAMINDSQADSGWSPNITLYKQSDFQNRTVMCQVEYAREYCLQFHNATCCVEREGPNLYRIRAQDLAAEDARDTVVDVEWARQSVQNLQRLNNQAFAIQQRQAGDLSGILVQANSRVDVDRLRRSAPNLPSDGWRVGVKVAASVIGFLVLCCIAACCKWCNSRDTGRILLVATPSRPRPPPANRQIDRTRRERESAKGSLPIKIWSIPLPPSPNPPSSTKPKSLSYL